MNEAEEKLKGFLYNWNMVLSLGGQKRHRIFPEAYFWVLMSTPALFFFLMGAKPYSCVWMVGIQERRFVYLVVYGDQGVCQILSDGWEGWLCSWGSFLFPSFASHTSGFMFSCGDGFFQSMLLQWTSQESMETQSTFVPSKFFGSFRSSRV